MSIIFQSQKFKPKTLETRTNVLVNEQNLKIVTDNSEGLKQIELRNDDGNEIIEDNEKLSQYESQIFDEVIDSGIPEQLIQLANLLKLQSKSENPDNSSIRASLATTDNSHVLNIVMSFNDDKIQSLDVSVDEKQWNISVNQEDENLIKYCKILKDKLFKTPKVSQSLDFNQLLKVAKLDVPIRETLLKDIEPISYIIYPNFSMVYDEAINHQYKNISDNWEKKKAYLKSKERGHLWFKIRDFYIEKDNYGDKCNRYYYPTFPDETDYNYRIFGDKEIFNDLQYQEKSFEVNLENIKDEIFRFLKHQLESTESISSRLYYVLILLMQLCKFKNNSSINVDKEYLFINQPYHRRSYGRAYGKLESLKIELVTELKQDNLLNYFSKICKRLDRASQYQIFSTLFNKIVDFQGVLDKYENLSTEEFCQQIYQQTIKSFQDEPEKLEIILADFYKLTQEPIFKSNTNILTTAQTIFIESNLQKNSNNLETKIELTSSFPEPITAIFIATDQVNTDTELNFITSEDSLRSISKEDIATYQNQLLQEFFSETIEANQVLLLANCLKFTVQKSENNQYSGILATNDENHQINYQLTPVQQNQYNLELESPQLNWKHDYQINLDNPNHINFLHRLDSDLVEFILSLTDEETVLKKAITLTPNPEAENYNSGYLTTCNGNNRLNYKIQVNSENNQNQFELSANKKTWTYQLDTSNLANRTFLQHVNPSLAVALEIQEALTVLANDDKIQSVLIRRQKNNDDDAISVYSKDKTTTELTVLIPSSSTDSSLQSVLSASQEIRIEQTYINDLLRYKLSFPNDDEDAKAIKITQIIDSTGKIQVQTTEEHPVKVFSDTGIITHHSDRISSETIEVEYNDYLEDATFTYHAAGQLIISNLIEGMKVEHYIKPPIQNIVNGVDESFILLKPEDKIIFIEVESKSLDGFTTKLISNYQINTDSSLQNSEIDSEPIPFYFKSKYGYVKNGKVVIPFEFDYADIFEDGVARVAKNGRVGYIDTTGKIVIPFEVENNSLKRFREGLAAVKKDGKWGYINKIGKLVIPYQFDEAKEFSEGLAQVSYHEKEDGKTTYIHDVGYINKKGEVIIPFEFSYGQYFSNGLAPVQQYNQELGGYKYGYIAFLRLMRYSSSSE